MSDITLTIRPGRFEDIDAEVTLHRSVDWCFDERSALAEYHDDAYEPSTVIVAETDGGVVGKLELFMAWKSNHGRFALIRRFVVADAWRGRGVGTRLLEAAVERAREMSCTFVELTVDVTNPEAHAFYKRYGFVEDRVEVIMRKSINGQPHPSEFTRGIG